MFIFINETGSDLRDAMRKFGYSLRGKCSVAKRLLVRGEHMSVITALYSPNMFIFIDETGSDRQDTTVRVFKIDAVIRKPFRHWAGIPRQTQTRKT